MNSQPSELARNLEQIRSEIAQSALTSGRDAAEITLIAVTKTVSIETIHAAYDLGIRDFGESKLQEALPKIEALPKDIIWHFIGHLQSNKVRKVAEHFSVLHTICTESQVLELGKVNLGREVLIEVNIADELKKSGISVKLLDEFRRNLLQCKCIQFRGLMTVGPALENPEAMRPYFREMRKLNEDSGGTWLSMGMSGDFSVAIQEGATHVRIGSALFGARG